jgi:hypothetical protein
MTAGQSMLGPWVCIVLPSIRPHSNDATARPLVHHQAPGRASWNSRPAVSARRGRRDALCRLWDYWLSRPATPTLRHIRNMMPLNRRNSRSELSGPTSFVMALALRSLPPTGPLRRFHCKAERWCAPGPPWRSVLRTRPVEGLRRTFQTEGGVDPVGTPVSELSPASAKIQHRAHRNDSGQTLRFGRFA